MDGGGPLFVLLCREKVYFLVPQGETFYFAGTMPQTLIFRGPEIFLRNFKIPIDNWDFMLYPFCS